MAENSKPGEGADLDQSGQDDSDAKVAVVNLAKVGQDGPATIEGTSQSEDRKKAPSEASAEEPAIPLVEFESLRKEKEALYDRYLRKVAEFDNFRKRTEREKQDFYDYALGNFIEGLLPVLDGLERSLLVSEGETVESYQKGIELILKQLRDHLASVGVQPILAMGKMFDPNYHQAVLREETSNLPENEIIDEMQRGYTFKDRLLRPSMVRVAVPPNNPEIDSEATSEMAEAVTDEERSE
jgi:molecular chaperone GrpE